MAHRREHAETAITRQFVDALRECLGLTPLYAPGHVRSDKERFYQRYSDGTYDTDGNRRIARRV